MFGAVRSCIISSGNRAVTILPLTLVMRTTTDNEPVSILCATGTFNANVDWGDSSTSAITAYNDVDLTHTYASPGDHYITITGVFPNITYNTNTAVLKLIKVLHGEEHEILKVATSFIGASNLSEFSAVNTSKVTAFTSGWKNCTQLTKFPKLQTQSATSFYAAWQGCTSLTSFPFIDTVLGNDFTYAWDGCTSMSSFPAINTSAATIFTGAWRGNTNLLVFPNINTANGLSFNLTWFGCSSLTSFPAIDTSKGTDFNGSWQNCSGLTSFPSLNMSAGLNFSNAWRGCSNLISFPAMSPMTAATNFTGSWYSCTNLVEFPANFFDGCNATNFTNAFYQTKLSSASIDNILVSINSNGTSNGTFLQTGGSPPSTVGQIARSEMLSRGWTVSVTQ